MRVAIISVFVDYHRRGEHHRGVLQPQVGPLIAALLRHLADRQHGLRARADAQCAQHGLDVILDRLDRQAQAARDFLVGKAEAEKACDFQLPRRRRRAA